MKDQEISATGAAQKPFTNQHLSLEYPLPAGEGKGEGEFYAGFCYPKASVLMLEASSLSISLPRRSLAEAGVHPWFKSLRLRAWGRVLSETKKPLSSVKLRYALLSTFEKSFFMN